MTAATDIAEVVARVQNRSLAVCENCGGEGYTDMGRAACATCLGAGVTTPELLAALAPKPKISLVKVLRAYVDHTGTEEGHYGLKGFRPDHFVSRYGLTEAEADWLFTFAAA